MINGTQDEEHRRYLIKRLGVQDYGTQDEEHTVNPFITNTSEEFIKCRLDNFSMSFLLYYVTFSISENK